MKRNLAHLLLALLRVHSLLDLGGGRGTLLTKGCFFVRPHVGVDRRAVAAPRAQGSAPRVICLPLTGARA